MHVQLTALEMTITGESEIAHKFWKVTQVFDRSSRNGSKGEQLLQLHEGC